MTPGAFKFLLLLFSLCFHFNHCTSRNNNNSWQTRKGLYNNSNNNNNNNNNNNKKLNVDDDAYSAGLGEVDWPQPAQTYALARTRDPPSMKHPQPQPHVQHPNDINPLLKKATEGSRGVLFLLLIWRTLSTYGDK